MFEESNMCITEDLCCFCMSIIKEPLYKLRLKGEDGLTHLEKLKETLTKLMTIIDTDYNYLICSTCYIFIDKIYEFNKICIQSVTKLASYKKLLEEKRKENDGIAEVVKLQNETIADKIIMDDPNNQIKIKEEINDICIDFNAMKDDDEITMQDPESERSDSDFDDILTGKERRFPNINISLTSDSKDDNHGDEGDDSIEDDVHNEVKIEIVKTDMKKECFGELNEGILDYNQTSDREDENHNEDEMIEKNGDKANEVRDQQATENYLEERPTYEVSLRRRTDAEKSSDCIKKEAESVGKKIIHTKKKSYVCAFCNEEFDFRSYLTRHEQVHTAEKLFKCDTCNKAFIDKNVLIQHKQIHIGEKPYVYDVRNEAFNIKRNLTTHKRIHKDKKAYKCDVCQKTFNTKYCLTRHERVHTGEKPFKCHICNKAFSIKKNLTNHILVHTGEKPHECDVCYRAFTLKETLSRHKLLHTGEKPFKCDTCNKAFCQKNSLIKHKRIHTGEKPHACDICNKTFIQKNNLTVHKRIHTGEKPFKCDECNKAFTQKCQLNTHKCSHTID